MNKEQRALIYSTSGATIMTALGFSFALITDSDAILLEALFNLVTLIMSLFTLKVAQLISSGDSDKFQFGYFGFEPMLNMSKGVIILTLCLIAGVDSFLVILDGGKELNIGLAALYAISATIICFITALVLNHFKRLLHSPLVDLEAFNWWVNGLISAGVAATFLLAYLLEETQWHILIPYVDPVIVLTLIMMVITIPLQIINKSFNQLLGGAPDIKLQKDIHAEISRLQKTHALESTHTKMTISGRLLYINIQVLVSKKYRISRIKQLDDIRIAFENAISNLHPETKLDVMFNESS